ncbi:MAG: hypothetical protein HY286_12145 [Planctomycetes bacterium]|nr:hypothetical protein [Planctomycetota bacterium]
MRYIQQLPRLAVLIVVFAIAIAGGVLWRSWRSKPATLELKFLTKPPAESVVRLCFANQLEIDIESPKYWSTFESRSMERLFAMIDCGGRESIIINDIPEGEYILYAMADASTNEERILATGHVQLHSGMRVSVPMKLREAPKVLSGDPVKLAGTLQLPRAWAKSNVRLKIARVRGDYLNIQDDEKEIALREMPSRGDNIYLWNADGVIPYKYKLQIEPLGICEVVDVPPAGLTNVELRVPEPVDVSIRIVDKAGVDAADVDLIWWSRCPEGESSAQAESASRNPKSGLFTFRAPEGSLTLQSTGYPYKFTRTTVSLTPNAFRTTITLERACGVRALAPGQPEMINSRLPLFAKSVGHSGRQSGIWTANGKCGVNVTLPGKYLVGVFKIKGYKPIESQIVEIPAETIVDVNFELVREK